METYEIYQLGDDLESIENFLLDVISNDKKIRRNGLSEVLHLDSFEETSEALSTLEAKFSNFSKTANIISPSIGAKFDDLIKGSDLSKASAEISVSLKIAKRSENNHSPEDPILRFVRALSRRYFGNIETGSPFLLGKSQIDIKGLLIDIERISPIVTSLRHEMYARIENDFETFKPSNVSIENVNVFIQNALSIVSKTDAISLETKENVEEYLRDIKAELARDKPAWKKVVGALVIVSAILGGLAVAPDALENVRDALHEILGASIDEISPKPEDQANKLPNFTIEANPSGQGKQDV